MLPRDGPVHFDAWGRKHTHPPTCLMIGSALEWFAGFPWSVLQFQAEYGDLRLQFLIASIWPLLPRVKVGFRSNSLSIVLPHRLPLAQLGFPLPPGTQVSNVFNIHPHHSDAIQIYCLPWIFHEHPCFLRGSRAIETECFTASRDS